MASDVWLSEDDAQDILGAAAHGREDGHLDTREFPTELLVRAGATVLRALRRQALELERERGRNYRDESLRVQGARLLDSTDGGGRRHYLRGEPVHCGAGLYLLTFNGWLSGRYERTVNNATFWFSVPGVLEECIVRIHHDMLFAWPSDVEPSRRSGLSNGPRVAGV